MTTEDNTKQDHPIADALRMFFGYIIMLVGALIALVSGTCLLLVMGFAGAVSDVELIGLPFLVGLGFFFLGRVIVNWKQEITKSE